MTRPTRVYKGVLFKTSMRRAARYGLVRANILQGAIAGLIIVGTLSFHTQQTTAQFMLMEKVTDGVRTNDNESLGLGKSMLSTQVINDTGNIPLKLTIAKAISSELHVGLVNASVVAKKIMSLVRFIGGSRQIHHVIIGTDPAQCDRSGLATCFDLGWDAAFAHNAKATISPSHYYQFVTCPAGHSVNYCIGWIAAQAPDYSSCNPISPSAVPCTYGSADYQNGQQDGSDKADADYAHKGKSGYDDTPPKIPGHPGNTSNDPSDVEYNQGWRDGYSDRWNDLIG
jgi:hypothetical protein